MAEGLGEASSGVVTLNQMLAGYAYALYRLKEGMDARDADATFRAAFESLNWASSIDDRIRGHWAPEGQPLDWAWRQRVTGAELMPGVRFVRNRVHHHWAEAIAHDESGGVTLPATFPAVFSAWRWRAISELPAGPDDHGRAAYAEHLERQPVEKTLLRLALAFEEVGRLLEPPRPAAHSYPKPPDQTPKQG